MAPTPVWPNANAKSFWIRVGGVVWGRRPHSAGGGQNLPPFRRFLIANDTTETPSDSGTKYPR